MSIIAEALKKAQKSSREGSRRGSSTPRKAPRARGKFNFSRLRIYAIFAASGAGLLLLILVLSVLGRVLLKEYRTAKKAPAKSPSYAVKADDIKLEEIAEPAPVFPAFITLAEVNEEIKVSGIMYTPQRPLVVINDNIWGEGDAVGKFKIIKIEKDFVKVDSNGREFIVKLKR